MVRSVAATDSPIQSLMCSFIPFYFFYYVFQNWEDTEDGVLLNIIPIPLLIGGMLVVGPMLGAAGG